MGAGSRTFRSKNMGAPENYDDDAKQDSTHPLLLPKPEKAGVVPDKDIEVLAKAMGIDRTSQDQPSESTPQLTDAKVRRRSVFNGKRYGPGNRPYWEMKEGQERSCYPNLIKALAKELDPRCRRNIWENPDSNGLTSERRNSTKKGGLSIIETAVHIQSN